MGRIEKQKRQLINEANKRMLGENWKDTSWEDDDVVNEGKKKKYEPINEGVGSFLLTAMGVYSFYKFIQGLRGKDKPKESNYGKSNWKILLYYVRDFIEQGGKIEYEDNGWYHVFKVGDVTIKIDQNNKTVFWTHIVPDIKRFLKYKPEKRFEFTDIDEIEHEHTIPIPISQENIDSLVSAVKEDMGHKEINESNKRMLGENWKDTSWEDDDGKITIGDIVDYIGDNVRNISVVDLQNKLKSQLDKVTKDEERIMKADLNYPIILVQKDGEFSYVLDGNHRLAKAIMTGEEYIKAKVLYLDDKNTPEEFKRLL